MNEVFLIVSHDSDGYIAHAAFTDRTRAELALVNSFPNHGIETIPLDVETGSHWVRHCVYKLVDRDEVFHREEAMTGLDKFQAFPNPSSPRYVEGYGRSKTEAEQNFRYRLSQTKIVIESRFRKSEPKMANSVVIFDPVNSVRPRVSVFDGGDLTCAVADTREEAERLARAS